MIVVPAFAEGEHRNPEAVGRIVGGHESPRAPHVRRGIHEPGGVQAEHGAKENSPQHDGQSAEREQDNRQRRDGHPVPFADPDIKFVFAKVGNVGQKFGRVLVHGLAGNDPAHVRPETAVLR